MENAHDEKLLKEAEITANFPYFADLDNQRLEFLRVKLELLQASGQPREAIEETQRLIEEILVTQRLASQVRKADDN